MASSTSDLKVNNNGEIDLWSIHKCVFCNASLNGESKILKCLHVICNNCVAKEGNNLGVKCKCLMVTKELVNYSIVSPGVMDLKHCSENSCNKTATKICAICKLVFCKPCSKVHLSVKGHNSSVVRTYPMINDYVPCPECEEKSVEVYCTKCSVMICSLCHLSGHRKHNYKILSKVKEEVKSNFTEGKVELQRNNKYLDHCLQQGDIQIQNLEIKKKLTHEKIDKEMKILYEELNKRELALKNAVDNCFSEAVGVVNDNKQIIKDVQKKNNYYFDITESILQHDNMYDFVKLSKIVTSKLNKFISNTSEVPKLAFNPDLNIKLIYKKSLKHCISAIKKFGDITSSPVLNLSEINIKHTSEDVSESSEISSQLEDADYTRKLTIKKEPESPVSSNLNTDDESSSYEPLVMCTCCNQFTEVLVQCFICKNHYHNKCHIPSLPEDFTVNDAFTLRWKCTLCEDITRQVKLLNDKDFTRRIIIGENEMKIIRRILLELYCQNDDSEHFRECPLRSLYKRYYEVISNPISLNDIKGRLTSDTPYMSLVDVIKDMKLVFSNGMSYYNRYDPYYLSAHQLQTSLYKMINKWIPKLKTILGELRSDIERLPLQ